MLTPQRLAMERAVLARKLPENTYHFCNMQTDCPFLAVAARTNNGNIYTVRIELMAFPDRVPAAGVSRMLCDRLGHPLDTCSGLMHVLNCDWQGGTRICHYGPNSWTPNVSLYKVFIKCRLWLELYELHLQTGKPIDYFVVHQQ
jgi:hypothetical protein